MVAIDEVKSTTIRTRSSDLTVAQSTVLKDMTADDLISAIFRAVALKKRLGLEYDNIMIIAVIASRHVAQSQSLSEKAPDGG